MRVIIGSPAQGWWGVVGYILGVLHFAALVLHQQCRASSGPRRSATAVPGGVTAGKPQTQWTPFSSRRAPESPESGVNVMWAD